MSLLTIDAHTTIQRFTGIFLRVLVDGVDVTNRCASVDAEEGWALVYRLDADGHRYKDRATGKPVMEILTGDIMLVRRADKETD